MPYVCCLRPRSHLDDVSRDRVGIYLRQRSYNVMQFKCCQVAYEGDSTLTHSPRLHGVEILLAASYNLGAPDKTRKTTIRA